MSSLLPGYSLVVDCVVVLTPYALLGLFSTGSLALPLETSFQRPTSFTAVCILLGCLTTRFFSFSMGRLSGSVYFVCLFFHCFCFFRPTKCSARSLRRPLLPRVCGEMPALPNSVSLIL